MRKKNILLISQSLTGGGAEKVVANLSIALADVANIYIVTYKETKNEYVYSGKRIDIDCIGGVDSIIKKIRNAVFRIHRIKQIKKENDIDYSISFVPQTDYVNVLTKRRKEKAIIEVSSNSSIAFSKTINKFFRRLILKKADSIVAVSEGSRQDLINRFGIDREKVTTIHNSCNIQDVIKNMKCDIPKEIQQDLPSKYIVSVGSFRRPKGHWHLIKAFSEVTKKFPDYGLVILGDGEYRESYEQLIQLLGIDKNKVVLPGFVQNPYPIIANSDCLVFTSLYEGFGNVLIEAMACGVPVLSVDCDYGPREIISPNTSVNFKTTSLEIGEYGWLTPAFSNMDVNFSEIIEDDDLVLANSIETVIDDQPRKNIFIERGKKRCMDFDNDKFKMKWINLLSLGIGG